MTKFAQRLARPKPQQPRYTIDPVAFFAALIGGPLLFTLASFWALFIPVFALVLGGPVYLVVGTPLLLWYLRKHSGRPEDVAFLALNTVLVMLVVGVAVALVFGGTGEVEALAGILLFGIIFAPAWGASFGWLYIKLRRDFYAHPLSV